MTATSAETPSPTRGGLQWTLLGRLSTTAANGVLMLLAALVFLDEPTFGLFAFVVGAQLLLSRGVLAGLDQGVVRLYTVDRSPDRVVRAALAITGTLGSITVLGGFALAAAGGLSRIEPTFAIAIGIGAAGSAWFDLGCSTLLARVEYRRAGVWMAAVPTVRAIATVAACAASGPDGRLPFVVFPVMTALGGLFVLRGVIAAHGWRAERSAIVRAFRYSWWIGLGDAAAVLALQSGLFILIALNMDAEAGRYGFALQLAQGFFAVFVAYYQAVLPKAARVPSIDALPSFLRWAWRTALMLATVTAAAALLMSWLLPPIVHSIQVDFRGVDPELENFVPGFFGLTVFMIVLMLEAPLGITCQYLLRPRLHVAGLWIRCAFIAILGAWLVPRYGELGAGLAQAGGAILAAATLAALVQQAVRRRRKEFETPCAAS